LVVGGGGEGIGGHTSRVLADAGAQIAMADVSDEALAAGRALLAPGARVECIRADVTSEAEVHRMVDEALQKFGRIDMLVNIAGGTRGESWGPMLGKSSEQWDVTQMLNLKYCYIAGKRVAQHLIDAGRPGAIVNIASMSAYSAPNHASYGAAKAGLIALTRSMALEWAPHGIRVNALSPGPIDTPRTRSRTSDEMRRQYNAILPFGRKGRPEEVANAVLFLVSDLSSYISGHNLLVDGACTIKFSGMGPGGQR
jgi:3-oxoacyl-[acyl-carrier protein] reductase